MVHHADKEHEESWLAMRVELLYLPIKSDDLVYGTMHQSETVLDHVHVDGCAAIFVSVSQFKQLWVIVNQPR